ncbi:MAG: OmpA family protein [Spirosomataceae bacterium]
MPEKGSVIALNNIYFDQSSPVLREESFPQLNELAVFLTQNPTMKIEIRGHTDNVGDFDLNVALSRERCQSVVEYLVQKGIDATRLQSVGRGPLDAVAPNTTEENRKKNRRVVFVVL